MGHMAGFDNPLAGAQMPPEIGVGGGTRRHGQKAEEENSGKQGAAASD